LEFVAPYWNAVVVDPLIWVLRFLAGATGSGGLAIILMTLIIKTILLPASFKQTASMKAMQALQPEIAALRKKHKEREKVTQETMKLYKERGINPASGCLPMLPTMVVLFGLYWALQNLTASNAEGVCVPPCDPEFQQPFLWVPRLDHPDVFHLADLPIPGILPFAMAVTQAFYSKMSVMPTQDPQQQMMNRMMTIMMPGMMLFWGITFPAGLVLYWFVSNVFEMVRLYFTMGPESLKMGSFSFSSLLPGRSAQPDSDGVEGDGARASHSVGSGQADQVDAGEIQGGGPRADGRPARTRRKRGRRSGRR
jgi:YidC/Oxa1 family membrane protein insertase